MTRGLARARSHIRTRRQIERLRRLLKPGTIHLACPRLVHPPNLRPSPAPLDSVAGGGFVPGIPAKTTLKLYLAAYPTLPRHYLRVHKGRAHGPDAVLGYVAWDQRCWPFRLSAPCEWSTEPVTLEVVAKERWAMQPRQHKPLKRSP